MRNREGWTAGDLLLLIVLLTAFACIFWKCFAWGETIRWQAATTYTTDNGVKGSYLPEEMETMRFYLRARREGDTSPRSVFSGTDNGVTVWDGDLRFMLSAPDNSVWSFTVSQAYPVDNGAELESAESPEVLYRFPFVQRNPGVPSQMMVSPD